MNYFPRIFQIYYSIFKSFRNTLKNLSIALLRYDIYLFYII